jgi:4-hydroxybenzoyl-CoA reductase subunit beta
LRLPQFEFVKPTSIDEGLAVLEASEGRARLLAGGTDLLVNMKLGVSKPETVVSISAIPELTTVSKANDGSFRIGACSTLSSLQEHAELGKQFPAVAKAIKSVASKHIRNKATIGGNLCLENRCWYFNQSNLWRSSRALCLKTGGDLCHAIKNSTRCHAINNSDTAPALLSASAHVVARRSGRERTIPLAAFFKNDGLEPNGLLAGEILTEIVLPPRDPDVHSTFIKVCDRKGIDFADGSIAASILAKQGDTSEVTIIAGSLNSAPIRLTKAEDIIRDSGLTETAIEAASAAAKSEVGTLTNLFTSAGHKRHLINILVKKALNNLKVQVAR